MEEHNLATVLGTLTSYLEIMVMESMGLSPPLPPVLIWLQDRGADPLGRDPFIFHDFKSPCPRIDPPASYEMNVKPALLEPWGSRRLYRNQS